MNVDTLLEDLGKSKLIHLISQIPDLVKQMKKELLTIKPDNVYDYIKPKMVKLYDIIKREAEKNDIIITESELTLDEAKLRYDLFTLLDRVVSSAKLIVKYSYNEDKRGVETVLKDILLSIKTMKTSPRERNDAYNPTDGKQLSNFARKLNILRGNY